ncbi:F16A2 protein, partial [Chordeiles acutipennis]|nr:F16A2 protein [Chordeiles acutipennis]
MERMSWLSKLHPRAGGQRAPRSASLQSPVTADPETCLMVFKNHWSQVLRILERRGCKAAPDDLSAVRNNTYQLLNLLAEDRPRGDASQGPILEFVASENLLERLLCWHLQGDFTEERKVEQLKLYEMLISQARQPLLRHKPVLTPLLRLLSLCAEPSSAALENSLVLLLNQLCVSVAKEPAVLELFFHSHADQGPANLIIFSLLIPFIHHEGVLGQQARDALLLIMAMSASNQAVAKSITDNSYFCPVLATGLSALYSSLPRKIEVRGDDWHFLRREDWIGVSSLVLFMNSLEFCNAVIQVAHPLVQKQLVDYVHNGFLVPVMGPALHKVRELLLQVCPQPGPLVLRGVGLIAAPWHCPPAPLLPHGAALLPPCCPTAALLPRGLSLSPVPACPQLCMVSLSLFRTLLSLNCEDVMLQLVLRYLLPCSHVMLSQKRAVRDLDIYGRTAAKFLSLIPRCCRPESPPAPGRDEEHAAWSRGHGSPGVDASSVVTVPKPSTPSRLSFFMRQQSATPEAAPAPRSPGTPAGSPCHRAGRWEEVAELDRNYLEYLRDARLSIDRCAWACRNGAAATPTPRPQPPGWEPLPSVDSLIEELLARAPAEPNGAGVTIETFTEELREIEAEMGRDGNDGTDPPEPPLSREEEETFASFAALPEGDAAGRAPPRPPDPLAQLVASPPRAGGLPPTQPFTGPFVAVLFGKLENMLHNSLYVNFLLTGLVAQLACYPQPLLRSFLLNTNMVFQPSVKSLLQVLGSVKNKIESFAASQEDFPALLFKAKKYLIARGKLDWSDTPGAVPTLRRADTLGES